jgi:predicted GH43/DUF377 family glycosyl hydrolase
MNYLKNTLFTIIFQSLWLLSYAQEKQWMLGPFAKVDSANPVLEPGNTTFYCPMRKTIVAWENNHVFNPAAITVNNTVYVLYRAEDTSGQGIGGHTSRIGLATSTDGLHFKRMAKPVIYPRNDMAKNLEWTGGCEDPRIVQAENGTYVITYTMWNRQFARIGVATSKDLLHWKKHGFAFQNASGGKYVNMHTKSASIICKQKENNLVAAKINGKYWMYWGDVSIQIATSVDLIHWTPLVDSSGELIKVISPRKYKFDSDLAEPGPPAIITKDGIVLLYNGKNSAINGDSTLAADTYAAGQLLLDINNPAKVLDRSETYFFKPERPYEKTGQYAAGTVFIEGLVRFKNKWFLYYGTADSKVAVAVCEAGINPAINQLN